MDDFWRMIWEQQTLLIVMLTKEVEKDGQKADRYWPEPQPKQSAGAAQKPLKSALTGAPIHYLADAPSANANGKSANDNKSGTYDWTD